MDFHQLNKTDASAGAGYAGPGAFFNTVYRTFQRAERLVGGPVDRFYAIGGHVVRLRFAGPALVPAITPALKHLSVEPVPEPALTVCLWDSASTHTNMPPPPWSADDYIARGEVRGYNDGPIRTAVDIGAGMLSMLDKERDLGVLWIRDAARLPYYVSGAPLLMILHWWVQDQGLLLVHAGAVGTPKGGVLFGGKGGSGKSTTALACLGSKLLYASDDYCLLSAHPPHHAPYVSSLYNTAKLDAGAMQRFPRLAASVCNRKSLDTEKALLFLHENYREKIVRGFPIRAILLPKISGRRNTALKPISAVSGLKSLAPSTIFQLSGAGHSEFQSLARIVKQVPCYSLELGTDISTIPDVILGLLSKG